MESGKPNILPFDQINPDLSSLYAKRFRTSKVIYLFCLLLLLSCGVVLPLVKVKIHTQSRGFIRSSLQNNRIHSVLPGLIIEQNLSENKAVRKGDLLLRLNSSKIDQKVQFNQTQIQQYQEWIEDLQNLLSVASITGQRLKTSFYRLDLLQYHKQLRAHQVKIEQAIRQLDRSEQLHQAGAIADTQLEADQYQVDLLQSQEASFKEQQRTKWSIQLQEYKDKKAELIASNQQLAQEKQQYELRAPIAGIITQFSGIQVGNYVTPGQEIAQISADDSLLVECYLSPADIGLLELGTPVKFQIDAFNYNQWGLAAGKVTMISKDVNLIEGNPFFLVRCSLDSKALYLKNGYEGVMKKGMTLNARFEITERTLFQLLYDQFDNWLNPSLNSTK